MLDTGKNIPESRETLLLQQEALRLRKRSVQMFPKGTEELKLPRGMRRTYNERGIFHFNPKLISERELLAKSIRGRENEFLSLGPYSKEDIQDRLLTGEALCILSEVTREGTEVRSAWGTPSTLPVQVIFFEATRGKRNKVVVGQLPKRLLEALGEQNGTVRV